MQRVLFLPDQLSSSSTKLMSGTCSLRLSGTSPLQGQHMQGHACQQHQLVFGIAAEVTVHVGHSPCCQAAFGSLLMMSGQPCESPRLTMSRRWCR